MILTESERALLLLELRKHRNRLESQPVVGKTRSIPVFPSDQIKIESLAEVNHLIAKIEEEEK